MIKMFTFVYLICTIVGVAINAEDATNLPANINESYYNGDSDGSFANKTQLQSTTRPTIDDSPMDDEYDDSYNNEDSYQSRDSDGSDVTTTQLQSTTRPTMNAKVYNIPDDILKEYIDIKNKKNN